MCACQLLLNVVVCVCLRSVCVVRVVTLLFQDLQNVAIFVLSNESAQLKRTTPVTTATIRCSCSSSGSSGIRWVSVQNVDLQLWEYPTLRYINMICDM